MTSLSLRCFTLAAAAFALLASPAAAQTDFYAGKTLKIIVGLPPGGGADAYARLVQRNIGRHIPGAPAIVAQNMPGAGSLRAVMALNSSDTDGTAMVHFSSGLLTQAITAPDRVKVDFKSYAWIGNVSEDVRVCYLRSSLGVRTFADMLAHKGVIFAGSAAGTAGNANIAMLRHLFGVPLKIVQGYAGSAAKRLAIERGEVDGDCGGWTSVPAAWLREKKINVMVRLSPTLVAGMDKAVPFGGDLVKNADERKIYDFLVAPERLGRLFMVAGAVPADRVAILRKAFDAMVADPAFLADAKKAKLLVTPMTGQDVARQVAALHATPAALIAKAKAIVSE
ncbi:MAG: Bug family tripartite tricarboxylate transporter substrate binding protein [Xanthobacteraceae bacterium]